MARSGAAISPSSHTSVGRNWSKYGWACACRDCSSVESAVLLPNKCKWLILGLC